MTPSSETMISQAVVQPFYGVNVCASSNEMMVLVARNLRRCLSHMRKPMASVLPEPSPRLIASLSHHVSNSKKKLPNSQKSDLYQHQIYIDFRLLHIQLWNIYLVQTIYFMKFCYGNPWRRQSCIMNSASIREWTIDIEKCSWISRVLCLVKNSNLRIYAIQLHAHNTIKMTQSMNWEQRVGAKA